jgi:hypothetical protein
MANKICPYLGLVDDPATCSEFPDGSNACHRIKKPVPVKLSYQRNYCLTESHTICAGYITGWETGFPKFLRADYPGWKRILMDKRIWLVSLAIICVFLLVILIPQITDFGQNLQDRMAGWFNPPATEVVLPSSTIEQPTQTHTMLPSETVSPSHTPTSTPTDTPTLTPTAAFTANATPTLGGTAGVIPFIFVTQTQTPEP